MRNVIFRLQPHQYRTPQEGGADGEWALARARALLCLYWPPQGDCSRGLWRGSGTKAGAQVALLPIVMRLERTGTRHVEANNKGT